MGNSVWSMADEEAEPPKMVRLITKEGDVFLIEKEVAMVSGTIKNMLSAPGMALESSGEMPFPMITSPVMDKICEYFHNKKKHKSTGSAPEFNVEPEIAVDVMMAANYLDT